MRISMTNHLLARLKTRRILEQEVIDAIQYPDKIIKKCGLYFYRKRLSRGIIEVVVERTSFLNIITVYWV
ncbi:DUF4258 domain-containing protein [Candidatus Woesearchaeota archaeon]|nr:DUF4258 domain-containing protein [Candidatus Woesearchaeota archaeon]